MTTLILIAGLLSQLQPSITLPTAGAESPSSVTTPFVDAGVVTVGGPLRAQLVTTPFVDAGVMQTGVLYLSAYDANTNSMVLPNDGRLKIGASGTTAYLYSDNATNIVTAGKFTTGNVFQTLNDIRPFSNVYDNSEDMGTTAARYRNIYLSGGILLSAGGTITLSGATPTISSGFGASPSVTAGVVAAFRVNVGTGGSATTGVVALPTAATGWNCTARDLTNNASFVTDQTASTTATASFANYSRTTGLLIAWNASDILAIECMGF